MSEFEFLSAFCHGFLVGAALMLFACLSWAWRAVGEHEVATIPLGMNDAMRGGL